MCDSRRWQLKMNEEPALKDLGVRCEVSCGSKCEI